MRLALVFLVFAGCMNPDEIFPLHGAVTSVDPVEGQVVRLLRDVQPQQCRSSQATPFKETIADAEGKYGFEVFRVEAQSLGGYYSYCFRVETTFPSGRASWTDPGSLNTEVSFAPLRDWRASPRLENDVLHFEPPVPWPDDAPPVRGPDDQWTLGTQLTHQARVTTDAGEVIWQEYDRFPVTDGGYWFERKPIVLDDVRLEDFTATVTLTANLYEPESVPYGLLYSQSPPPVAMQAGEQLSVQGLRRPVSRGLPCPELGSPCPLTDGDLTGADAGMIHEVTLEFPAPKPLSSLVLRGALFGGRLIGVLLTREDGGVVQEVEAMAPYSDPWSDDSAGYPNSFIQLPDGGYTSLNFAYLIIPIDAGAPVSRATLRFPEGLARIQEVSLFE
jgi:hypothetical protein